MAVTIVLSNQKGGVSKTTSAYVFAASLKEKGYKVLAVNVDPQGDLSSVAGADVESVTIHGVLKGELKSRHAVQKSASVDIVPANILLSSIELEFTGQHKEFLLKEALDSLKNLYDYILIDSPLALEVLTVNILMAASYVLVPALSDISSLQEITQLEETTRRVRSYCNPRIRVLGVFLTTHNPGTRLSKEVEGTLRMITDDLKMSVLNTFIRGNIALREAQSLRYSVFDCMPRCNAVQDYENLLQGLMQRGPKVNG